MQQIDLQAELPLSCADIFGAAMDFENYPQITPYVKTSRVLERTSNAAKVEQTFNLDPKIELVLARVSGTGKKSQLSRVTWIPEKEIHVQSVEGPFKVLNMHWMFNRVAAERTHVHLNVEFETGCRWPTDTLVKAYINNQASCVLSNLEETIQKIKASGKFTLPVAGQTKPTDRPPAPGTN